MDTPHHRSAAPGGDEPRPHEGKLSAKSAELPVAASASLDELRREWHRIYHSNPPRISRDLLVRAIGYRFQELQHGGLGESTRRQLKTLAKMFRTEGRVAPGPGLSLKPGARLVRQWRGHTHTVLVREDGFEYDGQHYRSLTVIAEQITGAHWSGPRFFGVSKRAVHHRQPNEKSGNHNAAVAERSAVRSTPANRPRRGSNRSSIRSTRSAKPARPSSTASGTKAGWPAALYDDGGFSGGTMDRPALQRLLADIAAGRIDMIVVYKIDRLTRSLADFAKIVEVFDAQGRLLRLGHPAVQHDHLDGALDPQRAVVLRAVRARVTGERIRDKIAASKKKGMWMGGLPSLGYDVKDRKLVVNEDEARTVLHIFRRYVELKSVRALKAELEARASGANGGH